MHVVDAGVAVDEVSEWGPQDGVHGLVGVGVDEHVEAGEGVGEGGLRLGAGEAEHLCGNVDVMFESERRGRSCFDCANGASMESEVGVLPHFLLHVRSPLEREIL